jgi:dCTP deaminase
MILTGSEIIQQVKLKRITIDPFHETSVNPNSYNFSLGRSLKFYDEAVLDPRRPNRVISVDMDEAGFVLRPDRIYLGHTSEVMGSEHYVPIIKGRSSTARMGLFIHVTADLIDIGSINQWTLQLHAVEPIKIYPGMLIGQVTFWCPKGHIVPYSGKYFGSRGPVESLSWKDFAEGKNDPV